MKQQDIAVIGLAAVSYTHLDVYKRQIVHNASKQSYLQYTFPFYQPFSPRLITVDIIYKR